MKLLLYIPQIVMIAGFVIWFVTDHPKASEAGRIMFFCGLLVTCLNGIK